MKKMIFALLLASVTAFGQRTNDKDITVALENPEQHEKITFSLNTEWFAKDPNAKFGYISTDGKIRAGVMGVSYMEYDIALANVKKKYGEANVTELVPGKVFRGTRVQTAIEADQASIYYGVKTSDSRVIGFMIYLPASIMAEWEPYFDNVAKTLDITTL